MTMQLDYVKAERDAHVLAARAKDGTLKIDDVVYVFTFDRERCVYDVSVDGVHVVTLNTRKVTVARVWLREYVGV